MGIEPTSRLRVAWPQDQRVNLGGAYNVYAGPEGAVSYAAPISPAPIAAWPHGAGKVGFGLGRFGAAPFGRWDGGLGFGAAAFGAGLFGYGAGLLTCDTPPMTDGIYDLAIAARDAAGNPPVASGGRVVRAWPLGTPAEPSGLMAVSYNAGADALVFSFGLSPDDQ